MQTALDQMSWKEVETYLQASDTIILPVGSTEQHGPMGLIGTDTFCAQSIAAAAAKIAGVLVAPALAYTPAPFNTAFPGTVSLSAGVFTQMVTEILQGLGAQGFGHIYILNGHGANIAPMKQAVAALETPEPQPTEEEDNAYVNTADPMELDDDEFIEIDDEFDELDEGVDDALDGLDELDVMLSEQEDEVSGEPGSEADKKDPFVNDEFQLDSPED